MGLASVGTASEGMQLCMFDLRRGQNEGQELDKILFFFPADLPFSTQLSVIGLSEGLITFTRIFSPEAACEVIEAERHSHVFYEAEPDIWMVMIVEKSKESEAIWRIDALREVLKEIHALFMMFHGSIRALLDKEPGGELTRAHLYPFIMDYLRDFLVGKKLQLPSFRDCLKERRTVQMLTVGREAAIEVQTLVRILESCAGNAQCSSLMLFQDLLVSTTLSLEDTINLFTYAVLRLTPNALSSGASSWSYLHKGNSSSSRVGTGSTLAHSGSVSDQFYGSHDTSPAGDNRYNITRPLQHDKWFKGKDGFLITDILGVDVGSLNVTTPTVWLQQKEERMYLCAYQYKSLTLILLIPLSSIPNGEQGVSIVKRQFLENASLKILKVEEKLSKGWGGENAYHVSGYRYLLVDGNRDISRASPPAKVTTLTKESLLALNRLREEVDSEKSRAKWDNPGRDKDLEVCIRAKNNAWIIARITGGKELYMVLEKANETLLYASDAIEKFSNRYCSGAFSLD
ncbi:vacuolar fusion protein CCZ1 homolog B-like isoform X2 [Durio zibethinus]|uniref:Vacuolar fusion protein CCZ1 homolog B-like isoform X2 n=1 Tax=Durio zibethinus TaxID=66656 RepID=A0A6P6BHL5_DURZI|nr:vacuolar fusion protein CCZ1 homolog B-like isoform X2 [Durio zibethinus]